MKQISPKEAKEKLENDEILILDVREKFEVEASSVSDYVNIPMMEIPGRLDEIPRDKQIGVLCHSGSRSSQVTMFLMNNGFDKVVNIDGGIDNWSRTADNTVPRYRKAFGQAQVIS